MGVGIQHASATRQAPCIFLGKFGRSTAICPLLCSTVRAFWLASGPKCMLEAELLLASCSPLHITQLKGKHAFRFKCRKTRLPL